MMLIDVSANSVLLKDGGSILKPNQIMQLDFWGFVRDSGAHCYVASPQDIKSILLKLLGYLDKERIHYTLSQACQSYLAILSQETQMFDAIKDSGKNLKDGNFDKQEFAHFASLIQESVPRRLKEHQLKAAFHLYLVENGANFSVPGSGKTTVVLCVYNKLKSEGKVNLLFVVGPPACFGPWRTEFELTLGRPPDYRILSGGDHVLRKLEYFSSISELAELYLITYQTLLNDKEEVVRFLSKQGVDAFVVVDEAHYIKQLGGSWAGAVLSISKPAGHRCVLTGTPFPRSYADVYNMFDFLWPNSEILDSRTKTNILIHEENRDAVSAKRLLKEGIGPLFYRVRKSELHLIPPVFHAPNVVSMNRHEKTIYDAIETQIRHYSKDDYLKNIDAVRVLRRARIMRLRQCTSYVKLISTALESYSEMLINEQSDLWRIICDYDALETPAKLEYLERFIIGFQQKGQKVLIWAHFIGTLELIVKYLSQAGLYCKLIYGQTPMEQTSVEDEETRQTIRDEFVDSNSGLDILVANPAACGESISLHKTCHHAVYYDLSYNCAQYLQSLDRIHRVGGSETTQANYYFLQYQDSIDQDIKRNLDEKARKMYDIVEEDCQIYSLDMFEDDSDIEAYKRLFGEG